MKFPFKKKKEAENFKGTLSEYPFLLEIKPKTGYLFRSNDYESDGYFYTILSYFHKEGAYDKFPPFWGIYRIPFGIDGDVSITCIESVERLSEGWVKEHQNQAENIAEMNSAEQDNSTSKSNKLKASKRESDLQQIAIEIQEGASYLQCQYRLQIKAATKDLLDSTLTAIDRLYIDRFSTLYAASYDGEERNELMYLMRPIKYKKGKPFYYTSTEYAGSYSLVTRGIEDRNGIYVGCMQGDVNTAGILFDIDNYRHHIMVCSEQTDKTYKDKNGDPYRANVTDLWGSIISQAALMNNHKVAHIILDAANMEYLGPKFASITQKLNMNRGDLNMFEMFGEPKDELSLFYMQVRKLVLMTEQAHKCNPAEKSIIEGSLEEVITKFYEDSRMWHADAEHNRDKLRIVGIPHNEVPKLVKFSTYLETEYRIILNQPAYDPKKLEAMNILNLTFRNLLQNNGDLFNTTTSSVMDGVANARRIICDFSELRARGSGIMMAQLLNIIAYIVGILDEGDVLMIHGADLIDDTIKDYLKDLFSQLYSKGGRICFLYNDNENMLDNNGFSGMDKADYTITGTMTDNTAARYQDVLGQTIPANLASLLTSRGDDYLTYLHRDYNNVIFRRDLRLLPIPAEIRKDLRSDKKRVG